LGVTGIGGTVISIITIDGSESASLRRIASISGTFITIITWSNWNIRTRSIIDITNSSVASIDWWTIDWIEVAVVIASRGGATIVSAKIVISANDWLNDAISREADARIASIRLSALELSVVAYVAGRIEWEASIISASIVVIANYWLNIARSSIAWIANFRITRIDTCANYSSVVARSIGRNTEIIGASISIIAGHGGRDASSISHVTGLRITQVSIIT